MLTEKNYFTSLL